MPICTRCHSEKPSADFKMTNRGRLSHWCTNCVTDYARALDAGRYGSTLVCRRCGEEKPRHLFSNQSLLDILRYHLCKKCQRVYNQKRYRTLGAQKQFKP